MKTSLALVIPAMLSLLMAGCGGGTVPGGRTGISFVDTVLDAIEAGDQAALKSLLKIEGLPCLRNVPTEVEPLCNEDEATGTLVETFAAASCVGLTRERANADDVSEWIVSQDLSLYAVYEAPADHYLSAQYVLLFGQPDPAAPPEVIRGLALLLTAEQIVGSDTDCGYPPGELVGYLGLEEPILRVNE